MCPSDGSPSDVPALPEAVRDLSGMRIDKAHVDPAVAEPPPSASVGRGHVDLPGLVAAKSVSAGERTIAGEQLRTQVVQLADHLAGRQDALDRREADLKARAAELEANLQKARLWFTEREADLKQLRQRWIHEHRQAQSGLDAAQRRFDEEHRRDRAELQEKRSAVQRRAEQVDCDRAALERVQEEVARAHRETLQIRLANEELRAELAPLVPPDVQQQALEWIRTRLSEEYRRANEELCRQKRELLAIRRDLAEQHGKLTQERARLYRLASSRVES